MDDFKIFNMGRNLSCEKNIFKILKHTPKMGVIMGQLLYYRIVNKLKPHLFTIL